MGALTVGKALRVVLVYELTRTVRNPVWVLFGLLSPMLSLVLFAPLLAGLAQKAGMADGESLRSYTPGVLFTLALLGSMYVGFSLVADLKSGLLERISTAPVSPVALIGGRIGRDAFALMTQAAALLATAALEGLRANPLGVALGVLLMMLLSCSATAGSYCLALLLRSENALAAVLNIVVLPLQLLGGTILPLDFGPDWLQRLGALLPSYWAIEGARRLFEGRFGSVEIPIAVAVLTVLTGLLTYALSRLWRNRTCS